MYHFVSEPTPELRLSSQVLVSSRVTQYIKSFQLEAVQFLYERLCKQEFCVYNDESGLGKSAAVSALLSALQTNYKKTLIVMQNDDHQLIGWQYHLAVLTELPVYVLQNVKDTTESAHSVYLAKWSILRSIGDLSRLKFDLVIVDNRGHTLNNNFCTSMLLKQYERKVNIVISSVDITSDVKLLYNILRLGGRLEHKYKSFRSFERKFHLPNAQEVFQKRVDLEEYYKQRGFLGEYIKDFRLRRYRHQFDQYLPLVTQEQYKTNLNLWLSNNNSESTLSGCTIPSTSSSVRSTAGTDEIMECLMSLKKEREMAPEPEKLSEHSDDVIAMSPLIFEMSETEEEAKEADQTVVTVSSDSDDCEIVTPPHTPPPTKILTPEEATTSAKSKIMYKERTVVGIPVEGGHRMYRRPLELPLKTEPKTKREVTPPNLPRRQTRGMQRLTRSAEARLNSKYLSSNISLETATRKRTTKPSPQQTPKTSKKSVKKETVDTPASSKPSPPSRSTRNRVHKETPQVTETPKRKSGRPPKRSNASKPQPPTPQLLSCSSISSDYLQCAQKVPENLEALDSPSFRIPFTPQPTPTLLLPSAFNLLSNSEVALVPNQTPQPEILIINSSHDEGSQHSSIQPIQSRRTRALKRKRKQESTPSATQSPSNFGLVISHQRKQNKSPDIFSNCSEQSQLTLAQPPPPSAAATASSFEGFKIFGSEVKQLQQQHASSTPATKKKRERSCLDILEQMFQPRTPEKTQPQVMPTLPITQRRRTLLLEEEDIFEITRNGEFGNRLRVNSGGEVSPVQQQQRSSPQQSINKITNYLISSGPAPTQAATNIRKSPKTNKSTQSTKLTRWFGAAPAAPASSGESLSAPNTPVVPSTSVQAARAARSAGPSKRKRLDLYK